MNNIIPNPFGLMRSADMTDQQIDELWVNIAFDDIDKLKSQDAVLVVGGKGSGKTHLLRHFGFTLQNIRWKKEGVSVEEGLKRDSYIGIYQRCSGLNASRFKGKNYNDDVWQRVFEYAHELMLGHELIHVTKSIIKDKKTDAFISEKLNDLFDDADSKAFESLSCIEKYIKSLRKKLDLAINNSAFSNNELGGDDSKIRITRGSLIFGIPEILVNNVKLFRDASFIYLLDEYENFTEDQQRYINTLIREKKPPVGIKIGVRKYGIKTYQTLSAEEEIIEGSEYQTIPLDENFRENIEHYKKFAYGILESRLRKNLQAQQCNEIKSIKKMFETIDLSWKSSFFIDLLNSRRNKKDSERPYFLEFRKKIQNMGLSRKVANTIILKLKVPEFPILEKVNLLNFYKSIKEKHKLTYLAEKVQKDCKEYINNNNESTKTFKILSHYRSEVIDQFLKDIKEKPYYVGIDNFIDISEGMPRNFINILKQNL